MLLGIFLGQYCINVLTWFFLTWFPIYLVRERGMSILQVGFVAVLPALCGFLGGILGGWISDALLRRGRPAQRRAQDADRRRPAAVDGDRRLQLRRRRSGR